MIFDGRLRGSCNFFHINWTQVSDDIEPSHQDFLSTPSISATTSTLVSNINIAHLLQVIITAIVAACNIATIIFYGLPTNVFRRISLSSIASRCFQAFTFCRFIFSPLLSPRSTEERECGNNQASLPCVLSGYRTYSWRSTRVASIPIVRKIGWSIQRDSI